LRERQAAELVPMHVTHRTEGQQVIVRGGCPTRLSDFAQGAGPFASDPAGLHATRRQKPTQRPPRELGVPQLVLRDGSEHGPYGRISSVLQGRARLDRRDRLADATLANQGRGEVGRREPIERAVDRESPGPKIRAGVSAGESKRESSVLGLVGDGLLRAEYQLRRGSQRQQV
jgi:hypothetical protein